jgi:hypothetical protein
MISVLAKSWIVSLSFVISIICIFVIQVLTQGVPLALALVLIVYNVMIAFNQWVQSIQSLPPSGGFSSKTPVSLSSLWKLVKSFFTKGRVLLVIITVFGLPTLTYTALFFRPKHLLVKYTLSGKLDQWFQLIFPITFLLIRMRFMQTCSKHKDRDKSALG